MFRKFHVAYHGTKVSTLLSVLNTGTLARAGDKVIAGPHSGLHTISIPDGHIQASFPRTNLHTGKEELFNPHQVFLSPVLQYSLNSYAHSQR